MAPFRKYEKVERWDHTSDIEGINEGVVHIQEKIDGANGQVFKDLDITEENVSIHVGSRNRVIARAGETVEIYDNFRGFPQYVFGSTKIKKFLCSYPNLRLYGEWLVKHTVNYDLKYQNIFWIFDVYDDKYERFLPYEEYKPMLEEFNLPYIPVISVVKNPSMEDLLDLVKVEEKIPKSSFGAAMIEGLVYKNYDFANKWGNSPYMKAVTSEFREVHATVFGATRKDDVEVQLISKYLLPARMEKIYQKMRGQHVVLEMKNVPQFMGMVFHDLITEDAWEMFVSDKISKRNKGNISIPTLKRACDTKAKNWYTGKLQDEAVKKGGEK